VTAVTALQYFLAEDELTGLACMAGAALSLHIGRRGERFCAWLC